MFDFAQARTHMMDSQILTAGIIEPSVIAAFNTIPREMFTPEGSATIAYNDEDLMIGHDRFLMEPVVHAKMIQALNLKPESVVLDIGCASGYSSAILSSLVSTVVALESNESLIKQAGTNLNTLDACNVVSFLGDLTEGQQENAPYDFIIFNGAVAEVPEKILNQLAVGGRMIVIIKKPDEVMGEVTLIESLGENQFSSYNLFSAGCPYLPGFLPKPAFRF
jgi:protein-L-isoaspartate(D-aspartate) O-methyltransferase